MGAKLERSGIAAAIPIFFSCYMFEAARILKDAKPGDDVLDLFKDSDAFKSVREFSVYMGDLVTAEKVLRYFGTREHYDKVVRGTTSGLWIPAEPRELMPFLHLVLPVSGIVYKNKGVEVELRNMIECGEQTGPAVSHLGVVFCPSVEQDALNRLLAEQASQFESEFGRLSSIHSLDFAVYEEHLSLLEKGKKRFGL